MKIKNIFLLLGLLFSYSLTAATGDWRLLGNARVAGSAPWGELFKTGVNDVANHDINDKINGLTARIYKSKRAMRNDSNRFLLLEFTIRMSPYIKDYDVFKSDHSAPFSNLCFGFYDSFSIPETYEFLNLLVCRPLYGWNWSVRSGFAVMNISQSDTRKTVVPPNDFITFQRESVQFAPVTVQILFDRTESVMEFYLNGTLQTKLNVPYKRNVFFTDFTLFWDRTVKKNEKRHFELSSLKISSLPAHPVFTPAPPQIAGKTKKNYDEDYQEAINLIYGKNNNWEAAFKLLQRLERKNHALAIYELGCCYYRGIGCAPDREKAMQYLKKAASFGITDAAALWYKAAGFLPAFSKQEYLKENYLNRGNAFRVLNRGTPDGKIIVIEGNQKLYAESLAATKKFCKKGQVELLKNELMKLANKGDAYALYHLATFDESPNTELMKRAARAGCTEAIRNLVPEKLDLSELPLEYQLKYACKYPLPYIGVRENMDRKKALNHLYFQYSHKKNPEYAFVYSELLLRPFLQLDYTTRMNAGKAMERAAERHPLAQAQYVIRFLDGDYGEMEIAKKAIKKLMKSHGKELFVKELYARFLEKEKPGKYLKAWQYLYQEKSAVAAYYLGNYALQLGKKQLAAQFRYNFLVRNHAKQIKDSDFLFPGMRGQAFYGFLEK